MKTNLQLGTRQGQFLFFIFYLGPSNFILKMVFLNVCEPHISNDTSIVGAHNQSAI